MPANSNTTASDDSIGLNGVQYILISTSAFSIAALILFVLLWMIKYRSLMRTIQALKGKQKPNNIPPTDTQTALETVTVMLGQETPSDTPLQRQKTKSASRSLWRPSQPGPRFTKADLSLMQLIKAGKEGVFYKAKMTRGTCKGHSVFTCKITKEEVSIMRKLGHHKNVLQLLDWNTSEDPYVLILEYVSSGTLRSFLQAHKERLSADSELQHLFTMAAYHIALAMDHLRNKMVVHCDLALRNILVNSFPREVKVAEFGLARDLTRMRSRRSSRKKQYFKNNYYSFKGDVWAFGIVLWEMQTFGTLPYHSFERSEEVVYHVCAGYRNPEPEGCRPEIIQMMKDCWLEPYTLRPSFKDIVRILETILENDADELVDELVLLGLHLAQRLVLN
ncbi:hypothetical protein JZ751_023281, partial [Albula glossodonta]